MRWHGIACDAVSESPAPLTVRAMSDYSIYLTDEEAEWIEEYQAENDVRSRSKVIRKALAHFREEKGDVEGVAST